MAKKQSLRERLQAKREELENKGGSYATFIFPKPGVYRMRHVPVGEESEFAIEAISFFLSKELGMVVSAKTFGEPCVFYDAYEELKNSKKESDRKFAEKLKPKKVYLSPAFKYKDEKGKDIDMENKVKLVVLKGDQYQMMIDLFLDDETGDFTHYKAGYDLKHKRVGTGQFDTKYSTTACPKSGKQIPKEFRGPYDVEAMVRELIPKKKAAQKLLEQFLNIAPEDDEDEAPKKKKKRDL